MVGLPGPKLFPVFLPVRESTEFWRRYPLAVASATASRAAFSKASWSNPLGAFTKNRMLPVSWQRGADFSLAMSMLLTMMFMAYWALLPCCSCLAERAMVWTTSSGSSAEVRRTSSRRLDVRFHLQPEGSDERAAEVPV